MITGIGPYTVNGGADQFRRAVSLRQPGDTMMLTLWREGDISEVAVAFPVEAPAEPRPGCRRSARRDTDPA